MALTAERQARLEQLRQEVYREQATLNNLNAKKAKLEKEAEEIKQMRSNMGETSEELQEAKSIIQSSSSEAKAAYSSNNSQYYFSRYDSVISKIDEAMGNLSNMNAIGLKELNKIVNEIQTCETDIQRHKTSISNKRAEMQRINASARFSEY